MIDFKAGNSKEAVANRMFRQAAKFWGLNDTNMDNFDPLVRMLVEGCAVEVYRIDNEIASMQRNMTERLAGLLTPEVFVQPRPAHAILHATGTEELMYTIPDMQFLHQKRIASVANGPLDSTMDLFFSPAGRFKITDADVKFLAIGEHVYQMSSNQQKETFVKAANGKNFGRQTAWLGINAKSAEKLHGSCLYFDLKNTQQKQRLLSTLMHCVCTLNGEKISIQRGLQDVTRDEQANSFEDSFEELYANRRLEKIVCRAYDYQFLTLLTKQKETEKVALENSGIPKELVQNLHGEDVQKLPQGLIWLKIEFPPDFTPLVLEDLSISLNCFPVLNRKLNKINYRLNQYFNIIPLLTQDQFFSVKTVEGTQMNAKGTSEYTYYPFDRYDHAEKGNYTVRSGDLQRFDKKSAAEYLHYLVELLRDESRAFAAFGQDFMSSTIKDLNQNINLIDQKIKQNLNLLNHTPTYLLINPIAEGDTIYVQFWTCDGADGNSVRSASKIELYEGSSFKGDSLMLLTHTTGGLDKLKNNEILTAYKSVLLSRNRLISREDIVNYSKSFLQEKAGKITVERGVAVSPHPNQGLVPVLDVRITPANGDVTDEAEWLSLCAALEAELQHKSVADINYKVAISQHENMAEQQ